MFSRAFDYLRDLKRKPKKTKQAFYFWTIFVVLPLVIFFFIFSTRSGVKNAFSTPETELTLGEKTVLGLKNFSGQVWQGFGLIYRNTTEFFVSEEFIDLLKSVFGKPRIEVLEPSPEINLPRATE